MYETKTCELYQNVNWRHRATNEKDYTSAGRVVQEVPEYRLKISVIALRFIPAFVDLVVSQSSDCGSVLSPSVLRATADISEIQFSMESNACDWSGNVRNFADKRGKKQAKSTPPDEQKELFYAAFLCVGDVCGIETTLGRRISDNTLSHFSHTASGWIASIQPSNETRFRLLRSMSACA